MSRTSLNDTPLAEESLDGPEEDISGMLRIQQRFDLEHNVIRLKIEDIADLS